MHKCWSSKVKKTIMRSEKTQKLNTLNFKHAKKWEALILTELDFTRHILSSLIHPSGLYFSPLCIILLLSLYYHCLLLHAQSDMWTLHIVFFISFLVISFTCWSSTVTSFVLKRPFSFKTLQLKKNKKFSPLLHVFFVPSAHFFPW